MDVILSLYYDIKKLFKQMILYQVILKNMTLTSFLKYCTQLQLATENFQFFVTNPCRTF
jgi:hypothetical protein